VGDALRLVMQHAAMIEGGEHDRGERRGKVRVVMRRSGRYAEIRVRNSGMVIPQHVRSRVFDGGAEPGADRLAIAYEIIVESHEGQIYFESDETRGTTFFVRLPLDPTAGVR
jgi:signal transduction histidine kinase